MSTNQVAICLVMNNTGHDLTLRDVSLSWGNWQQHPIQTIPKQSNQLAFIGQGKPWVASGTQGAVKYAIQNPATKMPEPDTVTLCFDDPWRGSNSTNGTMSNSPKLIVAASVPPSGSAVTFTYIITSPGS